MAWVGIVGGRVLPIHWFDGNVTVEASLTILKDVVWPPVIRKKDIWLQKDGARVHTENDVFNFLQKYLKYDFFSNSLTMSWPAKSPDLNPLDFCFWGAAEVEVNQKKPKTIPELKRIVEEFAFPIPRNTLPRVADNFIPRVRNCSQEYCSHIVHLLKKS